MTDRIRPSSVPAIRRVGRSAALLAAVVATTMCVDATAPRARRIASAIFNFAPTWQPSAKAAVARLADDGLVLDRVRIVIVRPASDTIKDTTITFGPSTPGVTLELTVPAIVDEPLKAGMQYKAGDAILFEGTAAVRAIAASAPASAAPPTNIAIVYVGPGATATRVEVAPTGESRNATQPIQFTATPFDAANTALTGVPLEWSVNDGTLGTIGTADGAFTPSGTRGELVVTARTLGDVAGSATIQLVPPPSKIVVVSGGNQTAAINSQLAAPLVVAVQAADNVGAAGQTVTFAALDGATITPATALTDANGQAQATITLSSRTGTYNFTVTSGAFSVNATATATIGAPAKLELVGPAAFTATSGLLITGSSAVRVVDAADHPVPGVSLNIDVANGPTTFPAIQVVSDQEGLVRLPANLALQAVAGVYTVKVSQAGLTGSPVTLTVSIVPGAADRIGMTTQPQLPVQSGVVWSTQPAADLRDVNGNRVQQAGVPITISIGTGGGTLAGTTTVQTNAAGVAQFTDLVITGAPGNRTLLLESPGLRFLVTATRVDAAPAAQLTVTTAPSATVATRKVFPVQPEVQLRDAQGNALAQAGVVVTASLSGPGLLDGVAAVATDAQGVARFTNLSIVGLAGPYSLAFAADGLTPATAGVTVLAGTPTQMIPIAGSGSAPILTAVASPPAVMVLDADNNPVPGVSIVFAVTAGAGELIRTNVVTDGTGIASTQSWTLGPVAGINTVTATAVTSSGIVFTGGTSGFLAIEGMSGNPTVFTAVGVSTAPVSLAVTRAPTSAINGTAFAIQHIIQLRDAQGNAATVAGVAVTASLPAGQGTLGGTATVTTDGSGAANFTDLVITGTVGVKTVSFAPSGLLGTSASLTLLAGAPAAIATVDWTPPSVTVGSGVPVAPVARVTDASGNPVANVQVAWTVTQGGGAVTPATATTSASGTASVSAWTLGSSPGPSQLTASVVGSGSITPAAFSATAVSAVADRLVVTGVPATTRNRFALGTPQSVRIVNASETTVVPAPGSTVSVSVTSGSGSLVGGPVITVPIDGAGVATFTSLAIGGVGGPTTLTFTTSVAGVTTATATTTLIGGLPAAIQPVSLQAQVAQAQTTVAEPPTVRVVDADGNGVANVAVVFEVSGGGGSVTNRVVPTAANGEASTGWQLGASAGFQTLRAMVVDTTLSGGLFIGTTGGQVVGASFAGNPVTFNATAFAGAPASMTKVGVYPTAVFPGATIYPAPRVLVTDALGNPVAGIPVTFAVTRGTGEVLSDTLWTDVRGVADALYWQTDINEGIENEVTATSFHPSLSAVSVKFSVMSQSPPGSPAVESLVPRVVAAVRPPRRD